MAATLRVFPAPDLTGEAAGANSGRFQPLPLHRGESGDEAPFITTETQRRARNLGNLWG
jgi:hypothetical protein